MTPPASRFRLQRLIAKLRPQHWLPSSSGAAYTSHSPPSISGAPFPPRSNPGGEGSGGDLIQITRQPIKGVQPSATTPCPTTPTTTGNNIQTGASTSPSPTMTDPSHPVPRPSKPPSSKPSPQPRPPSKPPGRVPRPLGYNLSPLGRVPLPLPLGLDDAVFFNQFSSPVPRYISSPSDPMFKSYKNILSFGFFEIFFARTSASGDSTCSTFIVDLSFIYSGNPDFKPAISSFTPYPRFPASFEEARSIYGSNSFPDYIWSTADPNHALYASVLSFTPSALASKLFDFPDMTHSTFLVNHVVLISDFPLSWPAALLSYPTPDTML